MAEGIRLRLAPDFASAVADIAVTRGHGAVLLTSHPDERGGAGEENTSSTERRKSFLRERPVSSFFKNRDGIEAYLKDRPTPPASYSVINVSSGFGRPCAAPKRNGEKWTRPVDVAISDERLPCRRPLLPLLAGRVRADYLKTLSRKRIIGLSRVRARRRPARRRRSAALSGRDRRIEGLQPPHQLAGARLCRPSMRRSGLR